MVGKNSFIKGINSDLSKLKEQPDSYLDALNFRVLTDEGSSSFALENTKGNVLQFTIPKVESIWKFDFENVVSSSLTITITKSILGSTTITITTPSRKTNQQLTKELNALFQANSDLTTMYAYYNSDYITVYDMMDGGTSNQILAIVSNDSNLIIEKITRRILQHSIIGRGYYENTLVLLTTSKTYNMPDPELHNSEGIIGTECFIWKIPIDNVTNQPIKRDGTLLPESDQLTPYDFLVYGNILNLSRKYAIYKEVKCRKENDEIARVIFTDNYNILRTINILDPQVYATPEPQTRYLPVHNPQQPYLSRIVEGGFNPTASYQIWYQLQSLQGAQSTISPLSNMVVLGSQKPVTDFTGAVIGTISNKSIEMKVDNIDTSYDIIRFGYTIYQTNNVSQSFFYEEQVIPESGSVTTLLNGTENNIPIEDITQLSNLNRSPDVYKTIEVVRNRLLAANAKTTFFDLEFDARAYRFLEADGTGSSHSDLYNEFDSYPYPTVKIETGSGVINYIEVNNNPVASLLDIPDSMDLINPYNNQDPDTTNNPFSAGDWETNSQFKYQEDGVTLGGTGYNISFKFIEQETTEDNIDSDHYLNPPFIRQGVNYTDNYEPGNGAVLNLTNSWDTVNSPYIYSAFTGYARGEVYRWGIVFLDKYGYSSPVKWIADIKMPNTFDGFTLGEDTSLANDGSGYLKGKQLGIEFILNTNTDQFQSIKDSISGWYFVRMERRDVDKTKLGIGLHSGLMYNTTSLAAQPFKFENNPVVGLTWLSNVAALYIPSFIRGISDEFAPGDYFRILGLTNTYNGGTLDSPILQNTSGITNTYMSAYRQYQWDTDIFSSLNYPSREITKKWSVSRSTQGNYIPAEPTNGLNYDFYNMVPNTGTALALSQFSGFGNKMDLITFTDDAAMSAQPDPFYPDYSKYLVSYERYLLKQYFGNTRAARYNNEYFPVYFQPYNKSIISTVESKVFNGDCVVTYWDYQALDKNIQSSTGFETDTPDSRMAIFSLGEVHGYNPKLQIYRDERSYWKTNDDDIYEDSVIINSAYAQEPNTTLFYSKALNQTNIKYEPNAIYVTDNKIDGERIDSWRFFRLDNTQYVAGTFGPINKLINFKDKLYYYQTDAFGISAIDERVLVNEGDSSQTQLGTGGVLARFDYISTETGAFNQFAVESSGNSIYHWDANLNKYFRFNPSNGTEPLSDVKGLTGLFRLVPKFFRGKDELLSDEPTGVHLVFNPQYNSMYITFISNSYNMTISFNELLNAFESRYSFAPNMYINMRKRLLSFYHASYANDHIYTHDVGYYNNYYGDYYPSTVKFRVNPIPDYTKLFDNIQFNTEVIDPVDGNILNTISTIQCTNDYQNTGLIGLTPYSNIIPRLRTWRLYVPRTQTINKYGLYDRMTDKYLDVEVTYEQPESTETKISDNLFRLHDVVTTYSTRTVITPEE